MLREVDPSDGQKWEAMDWWMKTNQQTKLNLIRLRLHFSNCLVVGAADESTKPELVELCNLRF